jgi:hypothetical protein
MKEAGVESIADGSSREVGSETTYIYTNRSTAGWSAWQTAAGADGQHRAL